SMSYLYLSLKGDTKMLKIEEIQEMIRLIDQSSIQEFDFEQDGTVVSIKKSTSADNIATTVVQAQSNPVETKTVENTPAPIRETVTPESTDKNDDQSETDDSIEIISPMVGTFYKKPSPESDNFVAVVSKVDTDTVVCIVEAMKLFNEIEAEVTGEIVEILVNDGELVEYGQPLFKVKSK